MNLYILLIGIIGFILCTSLKDPDSKEVRKKICILLCIVFIMQSGLRDYLHSHNDTYNYYHSYLFVKEIPISKFLSSFSFQYDSYEARDPGYDLFVKLTQYISTDFRFFLIIVAIIISVPLCWVIYRFTTTLRGVVLAALIYEALFAGFFNTGVRQTIAMGIALSSLKLILNDTLHPGPIRINKKVICHFLLLLLAYLMHSSIMIFAPFYFLLKLRKSKALFGRIILCVPILMIFAKAIVAFVGQGTIFEDYVNSKDNLGTPVFSTMIILVAIGTFVYYNRIKRHSRYHNMLITAMGCTVLLMPTTWVDSNFIRIVFYYEIFLMPLIPVIIDSIPFSDKESNKGLYIIMGILLLIMSKN